MNNNYWNILLRKLIEFLKRKEIGILLAGIILFIVVSIISKNFLTTANILDILRQISLLGIMSIGMTFILISKQIDLCRFYIWFKCYSCWNGCTKNW